MTKVEPDVETTGTVIASLRASSFKVRLDDPPDHTIVAKIAAPLGQHCIRIARGDAVIVALTPHPIITWRFK